ncbi:MAG: hypothetical protein SFV19_06635 [Rhodospirillaceae bacterium]|nr:hypothetical protein [Rhodospirillaceae bacterium]
MNLLWTFVTIVLTIGGSAAAQIDERAQIVTDALRYVEAPCASADQNPVCWAKTYLACWRLSTKYCPLIGLSDSEPLAAWEVPVVTDEYGSDSSGFATRRARGPLTQDPWKMTYAEIAAWTMEEYSEIEFGGFVAVSPERFAVEPRPRPELIGEFELREVYLNGPEPDSRYVSHFFRFEQNRWQYVSWHSRSLVGHSQLYEPEYPSSENPTTCAADDLFCKTRIFGLMPWPDYKAAHE